MTLTNPLTILSFLGMFAGLGLSALHTDYIAACSLVFGVFAGSALWWFLLSLGISTLRRQFNPTLLVWVNRTSGVVVLAFGVFALIQLAVATG